MRIYLDNCCFNRPYDDQSSLLVYLETEAKLCVQQAIIEKSLDFAWSYVLDYENSLNPYQDRRKTISDWASLADIDVRASQDVFDCAEMLLEKGIHIHDALHVACAIKAECDYFLTADKRLLSKKVDKIIIVNPIGFLREMEGYL